MWECVGSAGVEVSVGAGRVVCVDCSQALGGTRSKSWKAKAVVPCALCVSCPHGHCGDLAVLIDCLQVQPSAGTDSAFRSRLGGRDSNCSAWSRVQRGRVTQQILAAEENLHAGGLASS